VTASLVKCVVWDIDNTLLDGVWLESAEELPPADPQLVAVLRDLAGRGILHALASRNPPDAAAYVRELTGADFAAVECGWDSKADAIGRIAAGLDLAADAIAFVDDDMLERAEVSATLPNVLVLTPEEALEAPGWPQFSPAVITDEARRRGELYAARRRREAEAAAFGGSRDEFLRQAGTRITIAPAAPDDLPRLHELSVRTHQLNSAGQPVSLAELASLLGSSEHAVATVRLADNFGDDGLVGAAVLSGSMVSSPPVHRPVLPNRGPVPPAAGQPPTGSQTLVLAAPLVMMSCRALGRGALDALLAWLCRSAAAQGATELQVPCLVTERNVPMRLALAAAGLRAEPGRVMPDGRAVFARDLAGSLPALAEWVTVRDEQ
jgi:methoxymalonate biosynthesis protein